jgi:bifunctional DNA-binding transcriptional regulator/antitoxin component of YhaV-PrlF toxin-antitoxin module
MTSYNDLASWYNSRVSQNSYVMTVSRNGQVSIPADARARWSTRHVLVVDLGDRVVMRPLGDQPLQQLRGKYSGRGPRSDHVRREARREETRRTKSRLA